MAQVITNATWANFFWPISANGASPFGIIAGDSREYPVSTSGIPEYFTATDGSLFLADGGFSSNYPNTEVSGTNFFIGRKYGQNNLPDFYVSQIVGQSVTTDTLPFTITSDAYTNAFGQDVSSIMPSYVVTIGNMTEVA